MNILTDNMDQVNNMEQVLYHFIESPTRLLCITGDTGSGKTQGLLTFCSNNISYKSIFLLPKRPSFIHHKNDHMEIYSIQKFCKNMISSDFPKNADIIILDEFHVECLEKYIILRMLYKNYINVKKIIIVSATITEYHIQILETFLSLSSDHFLFHHLPSISIYHMELEYMSEFENWRHNPYRFISIAEMNQIVQYILKTNENYIHSHSTILIFVDSPNTCEKLYHLLKIGNPNVYTVHGKKEYSAIDEIVNMYGFKIIISTNILETNITIPALSLIIDFCICYSLDDFNKLTRRYCSKSEMIQRAGRTKRVCNGKVIRIISEEFYKNQPYIVKQNHDWKNCILEFILKRKIDFLFYLFQDLDLYNEIHYSINELIDFKLLNISYELIVPSNIIQQLIDSTFHSSNFKLICTLFKSTFNNFCKIMIAIVISLKDIFTQNGPMSLFYFNTEIYSYTSTKNIFFRLFIDKHIKNKFHIMQMTEMVISILCDESLNLLQKYHLYHLNGKMWKSFVGKLKFLLNIMEICHSDDFMTTLKNKLTPHFVKRQYFLNIKSKNIMENEVFKDFKNSNSSLEYNWFYFKDNSLWDEILYFFWINNDDDSEYDNGYQKHIIYLSFTDINIPLPNYINSFYKSLKNKILVHDIIINIPIKREIEIFFRNNVVTEFENEVAYRPGMYRYLEIAQDFEILCNKIK